MMTDKEARELAEAHWKWLEPVLKLWACRELELTKYLYITAMTHGIKHGGKK